MRQLSYLLAASILCLQNKAITFKKGEINAITGKSIGPRPVLQRPVGSLSPNSETLGSDGISNRMNCNGQNLSLDSFLVGAQ